MTLRISKAGLETRKKHLEDLRKQLRELRKFKGSVAIHNGDDWHHNNDFHQCEIDEIRLQKQICDLEAEISSAIIIDTTTDSNSNIVDYGAHVTIQLNINGEKLPEDIILFSDSDEISDFMKVSANSPLGNTIYQKGVGYTGSYNVDERILHVTILKIEY